MPSLQMLQPETFNTDSLELENLQTLNPLSPMKIKIYEGFSHSTHANHDRHLLGRCFAHPGPARNQTGQGLLRRLLWVQERPPWHFLTLGAHTRSATMSKHSSTTATHLFLTCAKGGSQNTLVKLGQVHVLSQSNKTNLKSLQDLKTSKLT